MLLKVGRFSFHIKSYDDNAIDRWPILIAILDMLTLNKNLTLATMLSQKTKEAGGYRIIVDDAMKWAWLGLLLESVVDMTVYS